MINWFGRTKTKQVHGRIWCSNLTEYRHEVMETMGDKQQRQRKKEHKWKVVLVQAQRKGRGCHIFIRDDPSCMHFCVCVCISGICHKFGKLCTKIFFSLREELLHSDVSDPQLFFPSYAIMFTKYKYHNL